MKQIYKEVNTVTKNIGNLSIPNSSYLKKCTNHNLFSHKLNKAINYAQNIWGDKLLTAE